MYSTLFTMPYLLVAHYHETDTIHCEDTWFLRQIRSVSTNQKTVSLISTNQESAGHDQGKSVRRLGWGEKEGGHHWHHQWSGERYWNWCGHSQRHGLPCSVHPILSHGQHSTVHGWVANTMSIKITGSSPVSCSSIYDQHCMNHLNTNHDSCRLNSGSGHLCFNSQFLWSCVS